MHTAVVLDHQEAVTLSRGGRITLTFQVQGEPTSVVLIGPSLSVQRLQKRQRQRRWVTARRQAAQASQPERIVEKFMTVKDISKQYGITGSAVTWGAKHSGLKIAKRNITEGGRGGRMYFKPDAVAAWRKRIGKEA